MGLFTPWESKNYEKRAKWIVKKANPKNQKHQAILVDIAKNDNNRYVKIKAIKKLEDLKLLEEISRYDDFEISSAAHDALIIQVEKLTDQNVLAEIFNSTNWSDVQDASVKNINDQKILAEIAKNEDGGWSRNLAVDKLKNQKLLADIAKNDEWDSVRLKAVMKLNKSKHQELLADLAKNDNDKKVRYAAVNKLTEQKLIADIAKKVKDSDVREAAIYKLSDQKVLEEIARSNNSWSIRCAAIEQCKIADIDIIKQLSKKIGDSELGERVSQVLKYLYHNALLTDNVKKLILQQKGKQISSHYDYLPYDGCSGKDHSDSPASYFEL